MNDEGLASPPGSLELTGPPVSGRHLGGWTEGACLCFRSHGNQTRGLAPSCPQPIRGKQCIRGINGKEEWAKMQQIRGNLSLGGSWQAGGASGRTETGREGKVGRSLFHF